MVRVQEAFAALMTHRVNVLRVTSSKDPITKATKQTRGKINTDPVPCYLSQKQSGMNATQDTGPNRIEYTAKVFFYPDADVLAGDVFEVTLHGHTIRLKAGEPLFYSHHIEVPVKRDEVEA